METYCKVSNCRFANTHVTQGHQCGTCKNYGHGVIECDKPYKINILKTDYKKYEY